MRLPRSAFRPTLVTLEDRLTPATVYGLSDANTLLRFDSSTPATVTSTPFFGLAGGAGEVVQGIDFRPRTGQLYAMGVVNAGATDEIRIYSVNPLTGTATQVGVTPISVTAGTHYGFDFNPTVGRIRVVNNADENFRINPIRRRCTAWRSPRPAWWSSAPTPARARLFNDDSKAALDLSPYGTAFTGGARVASGDVIFDGVPDLVTGAGPGGGPHVRVFDGVTGQQVAGTIGSFFAFDSAFRVASADFDLDGDYEIITAAGRGGGPHVRVFDNTGAPFVSAALPIFKNSFFAYTSAFTGGVYLAAGDFDGDGTPDMITGAGAGGAPHIKVIGGANNQDLASFFTIPANLPGGARVGVADENNDGRLEIAVAAGSGQGNEALPVSFYTTSVPFDSFIPFEPTFLGGVFVGGARA